MTKTDERPILERALEAIPGLAEAQEALRRVSDHRVKVKAPAAGAGPVVLDEVANAVAAGGPIPDDLGRRVAAAERAAADGMAEVAAIQGLHDLLRQRVASARAQGIDVALEVVRVELADVLTATRTVDRALGSIQAPEAAMTAGSAAVAAWQDLLALVARYDALRDAQLELVRPYIGGGGQQTEDTFRLAGLLANAFDIDPDLQARAARRGKTPAGFSPVDLRPPWPAPLEVERASVVWPTSDRPGYLRWLATGPAEPWVPPLAKMQAKVAEVAQWIRLGGRPETMPAVPAGLDDAARDREQRQRRQARWEGEDMADANLRTGGS